MTESLVAAGGSIGKIHIVGDLTSSEIKAGYNYYCGDRRRRRRHRLEHVGPLTLRGNLVDSVISASYRPNDGVYGNGNDTAGNGTITGVQAGQIVRDHRRARPSWATRARASSPRRRTIVVHPKGSNQAT